jgi:carbohydrate-binding DOMON domain-containing protein
MTFHKTTLAAAITAALAAGPAAAISFSDPTGDDKGPGTYTYPTDGVYKAGSFDLTKLTVKAKGGNAEFAVEQNSTLEDPWGMGVGFSVQMVFIFIDTGPGGHTETPPGINAVFAPGHEWDKVVVLSPQRKARVVGEATTKTGALARDIVVPNITKASGKAIKASVPLADLGGGDVEAFGYQVVMQSNEGFPAGNDFLTRKVNEYEGQHRWGGGNDADCDPHVLDVLEGPDATQAGQLAYECGADGKAVKAATLKMIKQ